MDFSSIERMFGDDSHKDSGDVSPYLNQDQHFTIGAYLTVAGILALIFNGSILLTLNKYEKLLSCPFRQLILHLCLGVMGMTLFGGFLFSGSSSMAGRWLFGWKGCQIYGFSGFLFGLANASFICFMACVRFVLGKKSLAHEVTESRVKCFIHFCWIWSLFWSSLPLLGWSSYDYEPTRTTCTINWSKNDRSYLTYSLCMMIFVFLIPSFAMILANWFASEDAQNSKTSKSSKCVDINQLDGVKMCSWLGFTFLVGWSPYAILCSWVIFADPETVPAFFVVSPPLFAKFTSILYPMIILYYDSTLRAAVNAKMFCKSAPQELEASSKNKNDD